MTKYESVLAQALELTEEERELLMIRVGLSLEEASPGKHDPYWDGEIKHRLEALEKGEEELVDWDEAERLIFDE